MGIGIATTDISGNAKSSVMNSTEVFLLRIKEAMEKHGWPLPDEPVFWHVEKENAVAISKLNESQIKAVAERKLNIMMWDLLGVRDFINAEFNEDGRSL